MHSSNLAKKMPWTQEPGCELQSVGASHKEMDTTERAHTHTQTCIETMVVRLMCLTAIVLKMKGMSEFHFKETATGVCGQRLQCLRETPEF